MGEVASWGILFQGVLLNKQELLAEHGAESVGSLLGELLSSEGVAYTLRVLRGPFSGVFIDMTLGIPYVFGNQTGDTAAYVGYPENGPIISNSFDLIMTLANRKGWEASFSSRAAQMMLQYVFMLDGTTFQRMFRGYCQERFLHFSPEGQGSAKRTDTGISQVRGPLTVPLKMPLMHWTVLFVGLYPEASLRTLSTGSATTLWIFLRASTLGW